MSNRVPVLPRRGQGFFVGNVEFLKDWEGVVYTTQYQDEYGQDLDDPIRHEVPQKFAEGHQTEAVILYDDADNAWHLEIEGYEYGVGHAHMIPRDTLTLV
jgi:hypothetical protein